MPRFKQKNRKKRKYTKRSSPESLVSLSRSSLVKLMPYLVMAVGLLTTIAITPPALQTIQPVQPIDLDLQEIAAFSNGILGQVYKQTVEAITLLANLIMQGVTAILHIMSLTLSGIAFVITTIGKGIATIVVTIINTITSIAVSIWHVLVQVTQTLIAILEATIKTIFGALTFALTKTIEGLNALWYFLTTPLRALAAFYLQLKPYLDFIGNSLKQSTTYLIQSFSLLFEMTK